MVYHIYPPILRTIERIIFGASIPFHLITALVKGGRARGKHLAYMKLQMPTMRKNNNSEAKKALLFRLITIVHDDNEAGYRVYCRDNLRFIESSHSNH